jgi:hypothetical protein
MCAEFLPSYFIFLKKRNVNKFYFPNKNSKRCVKHLILHSIIKWIFYYIYKLVITCDINRFTCATWAQDQPGPSELHFGGGRQNGKFSHKIKHVILEKYVGLSFCTIKKINIVSSQISLVQIHSYKLYIHISTAQSAMKYTYDLKLKSWVISCRVMNACRQKWITHYTHILNKRVLIDKIEPNGLSDLAISLFSYTSGF